MNEFFSWNMLHNRLWGTQPRLSDAETDELFELMADPSLNDDAMSIDMADGYLTAIAVGPSPVPVHDWLEDIFAQPTLPLPHDPVRQQRLLQLLLHRYADIQAALAVRPAEVSVDALYTPLSSEVPEGDCITPYKLDAKGERIGEWELKYWAEGFRLAVATDDDWEPLMAGPEGAHLLGPMVLYSMGYNPDRPDFQLEAEGAELFPSLIISVYAVRDWWKRYRGTHGTRPGHPAALSTVRDTPKVGRNDPCPCGSGNKFKKCCGA
ncbi:UPF0149 family protein [Acidovorax facilis]|uniref:UPF0149 family protein n=1 Tax=Acidovorax facilis TaxID=12917 RepID=UPI003CF81B89